MLEFSPLLRQSESRVDPHCSRRWFPGNKSGSGRNNNNVHFPPDKFLSSTVIAGCGIYILASKPRYMLPEEIQICGGRK